MAILPSIGIVLLIHCPAGGPETAICSQLSQEQNTGNERGAKGSPIGEERQFHYGKDYAGEVGLIFAGIGAKLVLDGHPVIDAGKYSAVVIMVVVTTLVTPPLLKQVLSKKDSCE